MSTGLIVAIAVVGGVLLLGGLALLIGKLNKAIGVGTDSGRENLAEELSRRGWRYVETDDNVVGVYNELYRKYTHPFMLDPLVGPPRAASAKDVITGVHRGRPFFAAVLDTYHHGEYMSQLCVWVRTPVPRPALTVQRMAALASRINESIGTGDLKTGFPEFDENFDVRSKDPSFAAAVMNPDLVHLLLAQPDQFRGFMLLGDQLDVFDSLHDHRDPIQLVAALDLRCDILDRIPAFVWS
ncbi:hypothetical protein SZMC14600_11203 [Saccharomonospora azurea SZMC 14600]|uniref:hypothetical protein n=1 Tax=Saccharomonospora azurea TaxID=40988 RepID=UPI00023FEA49|nr:hypothetical protein [Saccharomonospora azurea]EHK87273.1 hypothetical protein SZMC14600_11203 [Saccharomonospora azurea SZMC 14600]